MTINRALTLIALIIFILAALPVGLPQLTLIAVGLACLAAERVV